MSSVVGIDLSSRALDLVRVEEESNRCEGIRVELPGRDAWTRTIAIRDRLPAASWWEDVYLVAIEAPYGRGQAGTLAVLNRVVGAITAALPTSLRAPERCWIVAPHEWKARHGLRAKPTYADIDRIAPDALPIVVTAWLPTVPSEPTDEQLQNTRDALCLALYARDLNAEGVAAALPRPVTHT